MNNTTPVTQKELAVLRCFATNFYGDGPTDEIWSGYDTVVENSHYHERAVAAGVTKEGFPGIIGSLEKKGLAVSWDDTCYMTDKGYETYQANQVTGAAIREAKAQLKKAGFVHSHSVVHDGDKSDLKYGLFFFRKDVDGKHDKEYYYNKETCHQIDYICK